MAEMKGKKPPCATCKIPKLLPENQFVYLLISKYLGLFVDGFESLSASGIEFVFNIEQIPIEERPILLRKIIAYVSTALSTRQKNK